MEVKKKYKQVFANFLLWLCIALVIGIAHLLRGNPPTSPFPVDILEQFINPVSFAYVFFAGFILFGLFSFFGHKSEEQLEKKRIKEFCGLSLDEVASAFFNFGSLVLVASIFGGISAWYLLATLACYVFGIYLKEDQR
ncbi:hypothetical protein [Vreelandella boliviensis]|uniref:Uncharacterized protein n=1 Tax=Vreelandella boliviensis LC1 TaxID=1072583 RepID=A0A265DVZ4_9GAMM|nr:hypothetical protein [Halomonas boliviensis]EHJ92080.1 hypothetical protein KUC_2025 [Halomonas boliviensis LC1]OZT73499.1 hypothetical protein CE457_14320 [Halomonas boliviensis LC1]